MSAGKLQRDPTNGKLKRDATSGKPKRNTGSITDCCCDGEFVCTPTECNGTDIARMTVVDSFDPGPNETTFVFDGTWDLTPIPLRLIETTGFDDIDISIDANRCTWAYVETGSFGEDPDGNTWNRAQITMRLGPATTWIITGVIMSMTGTICTRRRVIFQNTLVAYVAPCVDFGPSGAFPEITVDFITVI